MKMYSWWGGFLIVQFFSLSILARTFEEDANAGSDGFEVAYQQDSLYPHRQWDFGTHSHFHVGGTSAYNSNYQRYTYDNPFSDSLSNRGCGFDVRLDCLLLNEQPCNVLRKRHFNCFEKVVYKVTVRNTGAIQFDVTSTAFFLNGVPDNNSDLPRTFFPGNWATADFAYDVNVCSEIEQSAIFELETRSPNGQICERNTRYMHRAGKSPLPYPVQQPAPQPFPVPQPAPISATPCFVQVRLACRTSGGSPCNQIRPRNNNCWETTTWYIDIKNIGGSAVEVDAVDVTYQGQQLSLLGDFVSQNPVFAGWEVRTTRSFDIDVCRPGQYDVSVSVSASLRRGSNCFGNDSYSFDIARVSMPQLAPKPTPRSTHRPALRPSPPPTLQRVDCITRLTLSCRLEDGTLCDSIPLRNRYNNCYQQVLYEGKISNVGSFHTDVTQANFTFGGQTRSILSIVHPRRLGPGQHVLVFPQFELDVCQTQIVNSNFFVASASPDNGKSCEDRIQLEFSTQFLPTTEPANGIGISPLPAPPATPFPTLEPRAKCRMDVRLTCRLQSDGEPCPRLFSTVEFGEVFIYNMQVCNVGFIEMMVTRARFSFDGVTENVLPSLPRNLIPAGHCLEVVRRRKSDVSSFVNLGARAFAAAELPNEDSCEDSDVITFNPNIFGFPPPPCATQVGIGCLLSNGAPCSSLEHRTSNCQETVSYSIDITNIGNVEMRITELAFILNRNIIDLLSTERIRNPLRPGEKTGVNYNAEIDVCDPQTFTLFARVNGSPPSGNSCDDDALVKFSVPFPTAPIPQLDVTFPTQTVSCDIDVAIDCFLSNGSPCNTLQPRNVNCRETLFYDIDVTNTGQVEVRITEFFLNFDQNTIDFLGRLGRNPLRPGEETGVNHNAVVNVCIPQAFTAFVRVNGIPANGNSCDGDARSQFSIGRAPMPLPTPRPAVEPPFGFGFPTIPIAFP